MTPLGADKKTTDQVNNANTAAQVFKSADAAGLALGDLIARQAREAALATLSGDTAVQVVIFDGKGNDVGHAG